MQQPELFSIEEQGLFHFEEEARKQGGQITLNVAVQFSQETLPQVAPKAWHADWERQTVVSSDSIIVSQPRRPRAYGDLQCASGK